MATSADGNWELTVSERRNAAELIEHTTVRPFVFMGHTFKCFYCTQYHFNPRNLLEHTSTHVPPEKSVLLQKHITKYKRTLHADISDLRCRKCSDKFADLDTARDHLLHKHDIAFSKCSNAIIGFKLYLEDGLYVCHLCCDKFHTFSLLNQHMNTHLSRVVCENCGAGFLNQRLLLRHKECHLKTEYRCKECDKVFLKKSQHRYHVEFVHKGKRVKEKKCYFKQCTYTYKEHWAKMTHLRDEHGVNMQFQCHICKDNFPNRRSLTQHVTKQHTEKYKCNICSKCFAMRCHLDVHVRGHTGDRKFQCIVCKNSFMHKSTLSKHIKKVHGSQNKLVCAECGSGFHEKRDLESHVRQWHALQSAG